MTLSTNDVVKRCIEAADLAYRDTYFVRPTGGDINLARKVALLHAFQAFVLTAEDLDHNPAHLLTFAKISNDFDGF
ncbi:hypothetical protein RI570_00120 [Brucella pseudogrignonensis]|uniref:hypothetical protein n=1 Tax=Brucella pseudogrignonensis TaxID=419475 RepID=UPI0028B780C8|nr:hypothetical protein [Brucella pseudogrignonensis]MDT6938566.1 hypothetical protein [Brucella pseudogrignonensis]